MSNKLSFTTSSFRTQFLSKGIKQEDIIIDDSTIDNSTLIFNKKQKLEPFVINISDEDIVDPGSSLDEFLKNQELEKNNKKIQDKTRKRKPKIEDDEEKIVVSLKHLNNGIEKKEKKKSKPIELIHKKNTFFTESKQSSIIEKLTLALKWVSGFSFEELDELYKNNDIPNFELPKDHKGIVAIIAVDPAPTTCAIAILDLFEKKVVEVDIRSFRKKGHVPDLGRMEICERLRKFMVIIDCPAVMWSVEDQIAQTLERLRDDKHAEFYQEAYAIQCFITGIIPYNRLTIASPSAIKKHFGFGTPGTPGSFTKREKYEFNKEKAIEISRRFSTDYIKDRIIELKEVEDHNICDAIIIAVYTMNLITENMSFAKQQKVLEKKSKNVNRNG